MEEEDEKDPWRKKRLRQVGRRQGLIKDVWKGI
jgi:hypothetical protein